MIPGKDYISVGVGILIMNEERKILLLKRGKEVRNEPNKWSLPGGMVEFGDTLEKTVQKEAKEELGVDVEIIQQLHNFNHIIPEEKQHWVTTTYICTISKGTPQIMEPHKCDLLDWFTIQEMGDLPKTISLQHILEYLKNHPL